MKPYGIISDTHHHNWSAFAITHPNGINSRLDIILGETCRAAKAVLDAGGTTLYHAGDLFHVRGSIAPSVLNPTLDCYRDILGLGLDVTILAGNHDLEGKEAEEVGSAITALKNLGCTVINKAQVVYRGAGSDVLMVPWIQNIASLKATIETFASDPSIDKANMDLMLHAPIDGTIKGLPDHGLDAAYLAALGFRRVFAGHYHHHKYHGNDVYSIGALTHQTWGDIDTKAGFLIVSDEGVKWHSTRAPQFVQIDGSTDPGDIPLIVDGNYARVTINSAKTGDVDAMRAHLMASGALGVLVLSDVSPTAAATARAGGSTYKAGTTLEQSIGDFIKAKTDFARPVELQALCADIMNRVRAVA